MTDSFVALSIYAVLAILQDTTKLATLLHITINTVSDASQGCLQWRWRHETCEQLDKRVISQYTSQTISKKKVARIDIKTFDDGGDGGAGT